MRSRLFRCMAVLAGGISAAQIAGAQRPATPEARERQIPPAPVPSQVFPSRLSRRDLLPLPFSQVRQGKGWTLYSSGVNRITSHAATPAAEWLGTRLGVKRIDRRSRQVRH